jgi:hypothetical protein
MTQRSESLRPSATSSQVGSDIDEAGPIRIAEQQRDRHGWHGARVNRLPGTSQPEKRLLLRRIPRATRRLLCSYVDSIRERYWCYRLHHLVKDRREPRVLMFVGAKHLEPRFQRISFPALLTKG